MYRKCATEISAQHQKQVTDSLLKLMERMPYESISVTQLCQAAGISRRVFYHLFSNKTGALHALIDHKILSIDRDDRDFSTDALRFFCYWKEQKKFLDALHDSGLSNLLLERMISNVLAEDYDILYWLRRKGWASNSKEVIIFTLCGIMGLVYSWYQDDFQKPPQEMAALMEQIVQSLWN